MVNECLFCRKTGGPLASGDLLCSDCGERICRKHAYELPSNHILTLSVNQSPDYLCTPREDLQYDYVPWGCYEKQIDAVRCNHESCPYNNMDAVQSEVEHGDEDNPFVEFIKCDTCDGFYCGWNCNFCYKCEEECYGCEAVCNREDLFLLPGSYHMNDPRYCAECYVNYVCSYCGEGLDDEEMENKFGGMCRYCAVKEGHWEECDNCHEVVDPESDRLESIMGELGGFFYKVDSDTYYKNVLHGLEDEYNKVYLCAECTCEEIEVGEQQPIPAGPYDEVVDEPQEDITDDPKQTRFDY